MKGIEILIDIATSDMTRGEVMDFIADWKVKNPGKKIWMDGDAYAIVTEATV